MGINLSREKHLFLKPEINKKIESEVFEEVLIYKTEQLENKEKKEIDEECNIKWVKLKGVVCYGEKNKEKSDSIKEFCKYLRIEGIPIKLVLENSASTYNEFYLIQIYNEQIIQLVSNSLKMFPLAIKSNKIQVKDWLKIKNMILNNNI